MRKLTGSPEASLASQVPARGLFLSMVQLISLPCSSYQNNVALSPVPSAFCTLKLEVILYILPETFSGFVFTLNFVSRELAIHTKRYLLGRALGTTKETTHNNFLPSGQLILS